MRIENNVSQSNAVVRVPRSFRAINGLRGPGALVIAFAHFSIATGLLAYNHIEAALVVVDMFFVFSGIVIAQAYSTKLARASAFPEYIVRRVGRIWPVQAAMLGILVVYELAKLALTMTLGIHFSTQPFSGDGGTLVQAIPSNLLLIHSLGVHDRETWDFPAWSLSVEFVAYLLFAAMCLVKPMLRHALSFVTILACLAILIAVAPYHMRSTFDYGVFRCIAGFLAGTLCQEIATRWDLPRYPMPTLVEVIAIGLFGLWVALSIDSYLVYTGPFVISLFVLCFILQRGAISRVLASRPLQILAEASFSIYMVHAVILIFLLAGLHEYAHLMKLPLFVTIANPLAGRPGAAAVVQVFHTASDAPKWILAAIYFSAVFIATFITYRWVEVPGRAAFGRFAKRLDVTALRPAAMKTSYIEPMKPAE